MLRKLKSGTDRVLRRKGGTKEELESRIGSWIWCGLLRRGELSILEELFAINRLETVTPSTFIRLSADQCSEFQLLLDCAPLLHADLSHDTSTSIYASGASPRGGGVVYTDVATAQLHDALQVLRETRVESGWYTSLFLSSPSPALQSAGDPRRPSTLDRVSAPYANFLSGCRFRVAISTEWHIRSKHRNVLEMEAVKLSLRHMSKSGKTRTCRVTLLVDSSAVLGALGKGRSAVRVLNRLCCQVFAISTLNGTLLELRWVPSALNPADGPSRCFNQHKRMLQR